MYVSMWWISVTLGSMWWRWEGAAAWDRRLLLALQGPALCWGRLRPQLRAAAEPSLLSTSTSSHSWPIRQILPRIHQEIPSPPISACPSAQPARERMKSRRGSTCSPLLRKVRSCSRSLQQGGSALCLLLQYYWPPPPAPGGALCSSPHRGGLCPHLTSSALPQGAPRRQGIPIHKPNGGGWNLRLL